MKTGFIHSIESMGLVDGPGIRTVVFMQGCYLRCKYCHNPDTWEMRSGSAREVTAKSLFSRISRFRPYFGKDGGVTFSGGEPLLQREFLIEMLSMCRSGGINTCLDTSGCGNGSYKEILSLTDLVLLDIKHYTEEGYRDITGRSKDEADRFIQAVQEMNTPLWIRHVVVPGITDSDGHLAGLESYLKTLKNIRRVELLPYHVLGVSKYRSMGIPYPLDGVPPMDASKLEEWNARLNRECCIPC